MPDTLPVNHPKDPTWTKLQDAGDTVNAASIQSATDARKGAGAADPGDSPPTLASIAPTTVSIAQLPKTLTLTGTNLLDGTPKWHLGGSGGNLPRLSATPTQLTANFTSTATGGGPGTYQIDVTTPAGVTVQRPLTVTA